MIQGIKIKLLQKVISGHDWANQPIYDTEWVEVDNVLIGEPSTDDVTQVMELYGKKVAYVMAIPKGDAHDWENTQVELPSPFLGVFNTIGVPTAGIEANIPLKWNKKVKIERYVESEG